MADIGYRREYKLRQLVPGRRYISVGIPYEVIEREATKRNLTVDKFIATFIAVVEYDNFEGVRYTFKPTSNGEANATPND